MDRYFIVFYDARNNKNHSVGNCWVYNDDGTYVNNALVTENIALQNPNFLSREIVITNVVELNKEDFEQFIKPI